MSYVLILELGYIYINHFTFSNFLKPDWYFFCCLYNKSSMTPWLIFCNSCISIQSIQKWVFRFRHEGRAEEVVSFQLLFGTHCVVLSSLLVEHKLSNINVRSKLILSFWKVIGMTGSRAWSRESRMKFKS